MRISDWSSDVCSSDLRNCLRESGGRICQLPRYAAAPAVIARLAIDLGRNHAAPDLIQFDAFEQRFEIAFPETLIALALNDFEEDGPNHILGKDLQQKPIAGFGRSIDQDAALTHFLYVVTVTGDALVNHVIISVGRVLKPDAIRP